jgi:hypothetical protein
LGPGLDQQIHSLNGSEFINGADVTPESGNFTTKHQGAWHFFFIYLFGINKTNIMIHTFYQKPKTHVNQKLRIENWVSIHQQTIKMGM